MLLILASPFLAVLAEKRFGNDIPNSSWRGLLIPPVVIVYIFAVAPGMNRMENRVLGSFRKIIQLDDESLQNLIREAGSIPIIKELLAIFIGGGLGLFSALGSSPLSLSWVSAYWVISNILMYALLGWIIYASIASTRLTNTLLNQPLLIDPFDISSFEPIGRQSLLNALVFVGGISLSLVFVAWDLSSLMEPGFWLIYIPLGFVPVLVFFLNMIPAHRALAKAKDKEFSKANRLFLHSCRKLIELKETGNDTENLPAEINALVAYQDQIQMTRTWPYNTTMLRTLFFSVLIPVGTLLGRIIVEALAN